MILEGFVKKVFHDSEDGFKRVSVELTHNKYNFRYPDGSIIGASDTIGVQGKGIPNLGESFRFEGRFKVTNPDYRPTFDITEVLSVGGQVDIRGLLMEVKGIGSATADKIINALGNEAIKLIINDPEHLVKLGLARFQDSIESMFSEKISPDNFKKLIGFGFTHKQISVMLRNTEKDLYNEFSSNPYRFIVPQDIPFNQIDIIAMREFGFELESKERLDAGVEHAMAWLSSSGSTYFFADEVIEQFKNITKLDDDKVIKEAINNMVREDKLWFRKNRKTGDMVIGLTSYLQKEKRIAQELYRMTLNKTHHDVTEELILREKETGFKLAESQAKAVREAVNNQVFVLKGGPGTGKSATSSTIK